jgi:hypothetical protein
LDFTAQNEEIRDQNRLKCNGTPAFLPVFYGWIFFHII